MSFLKKLFGGKSEPAAPPQTPAAPKAPAPPPPPAPAVDLSRAGQLIDCAPINWNADAQQRFVDETMPRLVGDRLTPLLLNEQFRGNTWFTPADAAVLFAMLVEHQPGRIMEIGCGYSTMVMRHAKEVAQLPGELIAVDPAARIDVYELVDAMLAQPVQELPISDFQILMRGEMLLCDTPHIARPGNEVEYLIKQVLPALASGVIVGFHGIRLPREYTREELQAGWNEQHLLLDYLRESQPEILFSGGWLREQHPGHLARNLQMVPGVEETTFLWFRVP